MQGYCWEEECSRHNLRQTGVRNKDDNTDLKVYCEVCNGLLYVNPHMAKFGPTEFDKVIFLDVDGVLNIMSETYTSCHYSHLGNDPLEKHLLARLEYILDRVNNCRIVVSSSWSNEKLTDRLKKHNFKHIDKIIGRTPRDVQPRGEQIKKWILQNEINDFIVLEDEISDVCGEKCDAIPEDHVIEVDMNTGLSDVNAISTIIKFNNLEGMDRNVNVLHPLTFEYYWSLGYRPQVLCPKTNEGGIDFEKLLENWDMIELDNRRMTMILKKSTGKGIEHD